MLGRILHLHLDHPGATVRFAVHQVRGIVQVGVSLDHLAGDRAVKVGGGLDGFHRAENVAMAEGRADLREVDERHVAQRGLRVVGDADDRGTVGGDLDPLVVLGVTEVCWNFHSPNGTRLALLPDAKCARTEGK